MPSTDRCCFSYWIQLRISCASRVLPLLHSTGADAAHESGIKVYTTMRVKVGWCYPTPSFFFLRTCRCCALRQCQQTRLFCEQKCIRVGELRVKLSVRLNGFYIVCNCPLSLCPSVNAPPNRTRAALRDMLRLLRMRVVITRFLFHVLREEIHVFFCCPETAANGFLCYLHSCFGFLYSIERAPSSPNYLFNHYYSETP